MENIKKLLDAAKAATGSETDYRLAKCLDLPQQRISDYYKGERVPDEFACLKIAKAVGMPLDAVIATVKAEAEKDEKRREEWRGYLKKVGGMAASVGALACAAVISIVTPTPAQAAPSLGSMPVAICIMSKSRRLAKVKAKLRRIREIAAFSVFVRWIGQVTA